MAVFQVHDSERKKRRELFDSLGDDLLRYIAELITNCDDSYRREEDRGHMPIDEPKVIYIEVCKDKRKDSGDMIIVTDNAEGMSLNTLKEKFISYEDDKAGGDEAHVRGLYGRGASDVLRAASAERKTAYIESIKDGKISVLKYITSDSLDYSIDVEEKIIRSSQMNEYRKSVKIPNNGTRVSFGIPSIIKYKKNTKSKLKDLIETYPSFRYLLNRSNRKIVLIIDGVETVLSSEKYSFENMEHLTERKFIYHFDGRKLNCTLNIYKNDNKHYDDTNIIVVDSTKAVYDNTMFDFGNNISAKNISGELVIEGLYEVCYEYLNKKDVAIFKVNRTGFDNKNQFYIGLNSILAPMLDSILREYGTKTKNTDLTNNKKFSDALKKLNKYISNELKDSITGGNLGGQEPPAEGIKFVRSHASITVGKSYDLKLLINSALIDTDDNIRIVVEENECINVTPLNLNYEMNEVKDNGLVVKDITIKSLLVSNKPISIEAECKNYKAIILIDVIDREIHDPINGFEFYPREIVLSPNDVHKTPLYFDVNKVHIGSEIIFTSEELVLSDNKHIISQEDLIDDKIGCFVVKSSGGIIGNDYLITAVVKNEIESISSDVKITITEPSKNNNSGGGLISKITLESNEDLYFQAYYQPHTHEIVINTKNPINIALMGGMEDKDPSNPKFNKEQRRYLCDIISQQAAQILVKTENAEKGEINIGDTQEAIDEFMGLIQQHKNKMFVDIYPALVDGEE